VLETAKGQFLFRATDAARGFLLSEGTDQRYGARHLKRAIERHVVYPLANLLATEQVHLGDLVRIDWDGVHKQLTFVREGEGALVHTEPETSEKMAVAADAKDGKTVDAPAEAVSEGKKPRVALPATAPAAAPQARKRPERS
jgi:ATP-dependent Clp protease ATP-binding subunit ClpB